MVLIVEIGGYAEETAANIYRYQISQAVVAYIAAGWLLKANVWGMQGEYYGQCGHAIPKLKPCAAGFCCRKPSDKVKL